MSPSPLRSSVFSNERSRVTRSAAHSSPVPGSVDDLERIIADLLPIGIPTDLMARRGKEAQRIWGELAGSPIYEALTIWVMAAFPEQMLDRVDTMVRTAIAAGHQVRDGRWSTRRLIGVVHKAGRRPEHREVHRHLGRAVSLVSYDAVEVELADEFPRIAAGSLFAGAGRRRPPALCPWVSTGTWSRRARRQRLDRYSDIAVDHLNSVQAEERLAPAPGRTVRVGVVRGGPAHEGGEQVESDHRCLRRPAASDQVGPFAPAAGHGPPSGGRAVVAPPLGAVALGRARRHRGRLASRPARPLLQRCWPSPSVDAGAHEIAPARGTTSAESSSWRPPATSSLPDHAIAI